MQREKEKKARARKDKEEKEKKEKQRKKEKERKEKEAKVESLPGSEGGGLGLAYSRLGFSCAFKGCVWWPWRCTSLIG